MINAIIKFLGGYTQQDIEQIEAYYIGQVSKLQDDLRLARKNDTPKDPKTGKFVKKKK